jgi:hypothetical protein
MTLSYLLYYSIRNLNIGQQEIHNITYRFVTEHESPVPLAASEQVSIHRHETGTRVDLLFYAHVLRAT